MSQTARSATRPEFLIKGSQGTGSDFRKSHRASRYDTSQAGLASERKRHQTDLDNLEKLIFKLQHSCVSAAEEIEVQAEKEYFYDKEIARMARLISELRPKKHKPTVQQIMASTQSLISKDGSHMKSVRLRDGDLVQIKSKKQKVTSNLNDIKAKNRQLRENLDCLRKERAVLDELFTKLEKTISTREQNLMNIMQHVTEVETATKENKSKVVNLVKHSSKEQTNFKSKYESQIIEMEKNAKHIASTHKFKAVPNEEEVNMYSEDSGKGFETERQLTTGPNFSSVIFNNSVAEAIDVARLNELHSIKAMLHKITVMTQEDDLGVILSAYRHGSSINDKLYEAIGKVESQLSEARQDNLELIKSQAIAEAGADQETLDNFKDLEEMDAKLKGFEARMKNLEKRISETKESSSRLEELLAVMRDCLFIGDEMVETDEIAPESYKDRVIRLADERSSQLTFIFQQKSGVTPTGVQYKQAEEIEENNEEIISKIVDFNNSQVKVKESERNRDHLISENLAHLRKDINMEIKKHMGPVAHRRRSYSKRTGMRHTGKSMKGSVART